MVRLTTGYTSAVVSSAAAPQRVIKRSGVTLSLAFVMRRSRVSLNHCAAFTIRNCARSNPPMTSTTLLAIYHACLLDLASGRFMERQPFWAYAHHLSAVARWMRNFCALRRDGNFAPRAKETRICAV